MNPSQETIPLIRPHQCDSDGGRIRGVLGAYCTNDSNFIYLILLVYNN